MFRMQLKHPSQHVASAQARIFALWSLSPSHSALGRNAPHIQQPRNHFLGNCFSQRECGVRIVKPRSSGKHPFQCHDVPTSHCSCVIAHTGAFGKMRPQSNHQTRPRGMQCVAQQRPVKVGSSKRHQESHVVRDDLVELSLCLCLPQGADRAPTPCYCHPIRRRRRAVQIGSFCC